MSQGFVWMLVVCGTIQAAFLAIVFIYLWFIFAARRWLPAAGTVITSRVDTRRTGHAGSHTEITSTPFVEYEYQVGDQSYRGDRIMIGGLGQSQFQLDSVLDRYPLGAKVVVYYNPTDPQQAVLERGVPAGAVLGIILSQVLPFGVPFAAIWIYNHAVDWLIAAWVASPYSVCFGGVGLTIFGYALVVAVMSVRASTWPITPGRIVSAFVERTETADEGVLFKPNVTYVYEVNGRKYSGGRVAAAFPLSSNTSMLSRRTLAKYPVGTAVDVHYNPKNPSEAMLHPWSVGHAVPWLIAAGFLALAWASANHL